MPFLALPACTGLCRPRFYGDPVGDRRHHLDWDSPMTRSIPLKEGRERDTEPVIPRGGPGEPLGHPSAAGIGVWPLWAPPPPVQAAIPGAPGTPSASAPVCLHPLSAREDFFHTGFVPPAPSLLTPPEVLQDRTAGWPQHPPWAWQ